MAQGTLLFLPIQQALDANNDPVSGAKLYFYLAGTDTAAAVYSNVTLTTPVSVPLVADSYGRFAAYYVTPGTSYKVDLQTSAGVSLDGYPQDNVPSIPLGSGNVDVTGTAGESISAGNAVYLSAGDGSKTAGQWFKASNANAYSSTTNNVGIATAAIASGASGTIRQIGSLSGIGPYTAGAVQYIDTAGALTATKPSANVRQMGQADTTSSLVIQPAPAATSNPMVLLYANTGTSTAAGATNVDTYALASQLTVKDTLYIITTLESVTQDTAAPVLYNSTDSVAVFTHAGVLAAGASRQTLYYARPSQSAATAIQVTALLGIGATGGDTVATFTTAWTGAWTLALRHGGVTAGGTFKYSWVIYKMAGQ